jgi:hypothetical protein
MLPTETMAALVVEAEATLEDLPVQGQQGKATMAATVPPSFYLVRVEAVARGQ